MKERLSKTKPQVNSSTSSLGCQTCPMSPPLQLSLSAWAIKNFFSFFFLLVSRKRYGTQTQTKISEHSKSRCFNFHLLPHVITKLILLPAKYKISEKHSEQLCCVHSQKDWEFLPTTSRQILNQTISMLNGDSCFTSF